MELHPISIKRNFHPPFTVETLADFQKSALLTQSQLVPICPHVDQVAREPFLNIKSLKQMDHSPGGAASKFPFQPGLHSMVICHIENHEP